MIGKNRKYPVLSKVFVLVSACQMVTLLCLVMVLVNDYSHAPIRCLTESPTKAIETFCYIQSTYTFNQPSQYHAYPGVGPLMKQHKSITVHKYFLWIPYLLTLQVFLLGFPRYCWSSIEGSTVHKLLEHQDGSTNMMNKSVKYFEATLNSHKSRALKFLLCEAFGVMSIGGNILLTNWYLEGRFIKAVPTILNSIFRVDQMDAIYDEIFPKVSNCDFHKFGSSGSIVKMSSLCVLARNLLSGRIYTLLFVVYFISGIIACSSLLLRIAVYSSPKLRLLFLLKRTSSEKGLKENLRNVVSFCDFGDWFLVYQFSGSMPDFHLWLEKASIHLQRTKGTPMWQTFQQELK